MLMKERLHTLLLTACEFTLLAFAQPAGAYYQAADGKEGAGRRRPSSQIIGPHEVQTYTPGVWDAINSYDLRPDGSIWDIYSAISHFTPKTDQDKGEEIDDEGVVYNREHAFPRLVQRVYNRRRYSTKVYPMYTDLHHLFPTDRSVNTIRSNYPYGEVGNKSHPAVGGRLLRVRPL